MFGYVQHSSGHLHIELKENGEWRALYVDLDSNHQWNSHLLNQERTRAMRSLFAQKRFHTRYKRFAAWLSKEVFTEFPEAQAFRTFYQQQTVPKPKVLQNLGANWGPDFGKPHSSRRNHDSLDLLCQHHGSQRASHTARIVPNLVVLFYSGIFVTLA